MRIIDVFNGDADGICALHQLRLAEPADSELVTGLKHEIALLQRVNAGPGDRVTVLDVSLERNRAALDAILGRGATVRYFDHHDAGRIPRHPGLEATIDPTGLVCTGELVDRFLEGRFRAWAVVAAFGDNFERSARRLAQGLGLDDARIALLRDLGQALNYNAYGESALDLVLPPEKLYRLVSRHADPFELLEAEPVIGVIGRNRLADLERARRVPALRCGRDTRIHLLPAEGWSRRVVGAFANALAAEEPLRAHAVLAPLARGGFAVSIRSPSDGPIQALEFCRRYAGGGGRTTAAGIERLEAGALEGFLDGFEAAFARAASPP